MVGFLTKGSVMRRFDVFFAVALNDTIDQTDELSMIHRSLIIFHYVCKSKSKSKKTVFKVGQCKQCNISSHLKWVLVADKSMHISKVQ